MSWQPHYSSHSTILTDGSRCVASRKQKFVFNNANQVFIYLELLEYSNVLHSNGTLLLYIVIPTNIVSYFDWNNLPQSIINLDNLEHFIDSIKHYYA